MSTHIGQRSFGWPVAGVLVLLAAGAVTLAEEPPEIQSLKKAAVDGKFANLLAVIRVPDDKATYGDFNDYGIWQGKEWAGFTGLPVGYWVYVQPHWYIWEKEAKGAKSSAFQKATAGGKYKGLLAIIQVPDDRTVFGDFNDYGPYEGTAWAGYSGLPKGNWVYVHPHWYIWEKEGSGAEELPLQKASVGGKYTKLLSVINVPSDKDAFGEFKDYGPYQGTEWAGYSGLPKGNWVYVYPYWYIWESEDK